MEKITEKLERLFTAVSFAEAGEQEYVKALLTENRSKKSDSKLHHRAARKRVRVFTSPACS